jgi:mismatch-specific thymine-DNA glycosylase
MTHGTAFATRRLTDRIEPCLRVLFVGINPGVRSALTGHHFAGFSNRFWKLLWESGLLPDDITFEQDWRLPEFGYGVTNLVARPSPGIDDLKPAEYVEGWKTLDRKIRRYRPEIVALVGVTLFRAIEPLIAGEVDRKTRAAMRSRVIEPGLQPATVHGPGAAAQCAATASRPRGRRINSTSGKSKRKMIPSSRKRSTNATIVAWR